MDKDIISKLRSNLFSASHEAIENWNIFPWHKGSGGITDTYKPHSSQALAIDVFGTLKQHSSCNRILNSLVADLGVPTSNSWKVHLEWISPTNPLGEIHQHTQVDAIAENDRAIIFFECKFSESDGGSCSQVRPLIKGAHKGKVQCDGNYIAQINPANNKTARCALSAKGIRYWDVIPDVFIYSREIDYLPCPFSGPWYQWMRNITNAYAIAQESGRQAVFCLVYADDENLPIANMVKLGQWVKFLAHTIPESMPIRAISFQELIKLAKSVDNDNLWEELSTWVEKKIALTRKKQL